MNMNTKKIEAVHRLVATLILKLGMNESVEDIVRSYREKDVSIKSMAVGAFIDGKLFDESDNEKNIDLPESARNVYYPWKDVLASMYLHSERVHLLKITCPDCGKPLVRLYFSSPVWTWRHLCGRAGTMTICVSCPKQESFILEIMN